MATRQTQPNNHADSDDRVLALQEAYANLYNELTQPDKVFVATQYFRKKWVPLLGHSLAWLIIALRQHCYWNKKTGQRRDWCTVTQKELAQEVGIDTRTMRRLLKRKYADKFVLESKNRYRYDTHLGKRVRQATRYRIRLDDPLTPEDEETLKQRLAEEAAGLNLDSETGQLDALHLLDRALQETPSHLADKMSPRESTLPEHLPDELPVSTDLTDKVSAEPGYLPDKMSASRPDLADDSPAISYTGQNVRNHDSTYRIPDYTIVQQQQYLVAVAEMVAFGIAEPALSKHRNKSLADIRGWIAYARARGLGPGFVVKRLENNEPPPPTPVGDGEGKDEAEARTEESLAALAARRQASQDYLAALAEAGVTADDLDRWQAVLERVKIQAGGWLDGAGPIRREGQVLWVQVRSQAAEAWLENRLRPLIDRAAGEVGLGPVRFEGPDEG